MNTFKTAGEALLLAHAGQQQIAVILAALRAKQHQLGAWWQHARMQRKEFARITRELATCTDRELGELGLTRGDIHAVASGTFPG